MRRRHLSRSVRPRSATDAPRSVLNWWTTQHHQRVLTGVPGNSAKLVQELALLTPAGVGVARRQSPRQIVPTGLLHALIVVAPGRISFEADHPCRVGKI